MINKNTTYYFHGHFPHEPELTSSPVHLQFLNTPTPVDKWHMLEASPVTKQTVSKH